MLLSREVCIGEEIQILSIPHFTASKYIVRALRELMSLSGSVQPHLELTPLSEAPFKLKFVPSVAA